MLTSEIKRVMNDLQRASSVSYERHTAEAVLQNVLDDISRVIASVSRSERLGVVYRSIYSSRKKTMKKVAA